MESLGGSENATKQKFSAVSVNAGQRKQRYSTAARRWPAPFRLRT
jgi:hypothetical protein